MTFTRSLISINFLLALLLAGALPAGAQFSFEKLKKTVLEPAAGCGAIGAGLGDLLGDNDAAKWSGIGSAALCVTISLDMDRRRKAAVAAEKSLDTQIAQQEIDNADLSAENASLRAKHKDLQAKANSLRQKIKSNPLSAQKLTAEITAEKEAALEMRDIVDQRIEIVRLQENAPTLSNSARISLSEMRLNLEQRSAILTEISKIKSA